MEKTEKDRIEWREPEGRDRVIREMKRAEEGEGSASHVLRPATYHHLSGFVKDWTMPFMTAFDPSHVAPFDWTVTRRFDETPSATRSERHRRRSGGSIFIGGKPGQRILVLSQAEDDQALAIQSRAAGIFADVAAVRSIRVHESGGVLYIYVIVDSWEFEDLRPIYERELDLRDEFPDFPLELKAVLAEEEDRVPSEASLLMKR